jgi:hypothetical protein
MRRVSRRKRAHFQFSLLSDGPYLAHGAALQVSVDDCALCLIHHHQAPLHKLTVLYITDIANRADSPHLAHDVALRVESDDSALCIGHHH